MAIKPELLQPAATLAAAMLQLDRAGGANTPPAEVFEKAYQAIGEALEKIDKNGAEPTYQMFVV